MATFWGLIIPVSSYFSLPLLTGLLVWGLWVLYSRKSQKQVTTTKDSETSRQHKLKKIRKFTAPESEENFRMECIEATLAQFSDMPAGWKQEYIFWLINRSFKHIFQHLENARSSLVKLCLPEQQAMISSTSSIIVTQEALLPLCVHKKAKHTHRDTMGSSHISSLSQFSVISEGTSWKFQSQSLPVLRKKYKKRTSRGRKQRSPLYSFYFPEIRKSKFLQNLEVLSPDKIQGILINSITEYPDIFRQKKKTKPKRKGKRNVIADDRQYFTFTTAPKAPECGSGWSWWELERHMAWKVWTLREQTVPLPVRESRALMNYLTEAQGGIPEPKRPQIQLSMSKYQSSEKNVKNKSPHLPSFLHHVNTEEESGLNRTETKILQSLIPGKQSRLKDDSQILGYRSSVKSMNIPPAKHVIVVRNQEATTFLRKDPKHVLELSLEQRVIGFPEKRTQHHKTQVNKVELTPRPPYQFRDNIKVTPLELLQVMDSMGMIPESHSEVIESVGFFPQSPNQAVKPVEAIKTASIKHKLFQDTESVATTSKPIYQGIDSERISRSPNRTDNVKVTPVELLQVMDSMGMIEKPHPNNIETTVTPRPQYQVRESLKKDTQIGHQIKEPEKKSSKPQHLSTKTVEMTTRQQNKIESEDLTSRPQNKVTEPKIIPEPFCQNTESRAMVSRSLPQVTNYVKITPVALLQTMDFMGIIPAAQSHIIEFRDLTSDSVFPTSKLTPRTTQSDSLITSNYGPKLPSRDIESIGMIPMSSYQSMDSLKVIPVIPKDMITIPQSQDVETKDSSQKLTSQEKISLDLTSGSCIHELGSEGITPPSYHEGTDSMVLIPKPSHENMEASRLTSRHKVLEDSEVNTSQSDQVIETMELTPGTCVKRKETIELKPSLHKVMESLGTISKPLGQGTELKIVNQKPLHKVTESAAKTTMLQNEKPVPNYNIITSTKLPPELQNYEIIKSIDITTGSTPQIVKYAQHIPTVNSIELAPQLQLSSVKSADLAPVSQSQTGKSIQLAPESQLKDVKSTLLSLRPEQQTIKSAELGPVQQLQSKKHIDLTPSSQLKGAEQLNLSIPPVLSDIKSTELRKRSLQRDTKLKLIESAPKLSLQDLRSEKMLSPILMTKGMEMPQVAECRRLITETQKQGKKYEELDPGERVQAVKSIELKSRNTDPEGLTSGNQALESLEMISEPEYQDTKTKLNFDTCHQTKESVGSIQSSSRDTPGPLSQASESIQVNSESLQSTPNTLQSMQFMKDKPASQYTIRRTPKLVPISEMQDAESEVLIREPQGMQFVHPNLGPYPEAINYEELASEPQLRSVKSMPSISKLQSKSIKPEDLSLGSFKDDKAFVDLTAPLEESRRLIPGKELLNNELRKLTMEPQLEAISSVGLTCRLRHQKTAPAELSPEIWPQKEESVISQKVTETAGLFPRSHCQFFSEPTTESGNKETEIMRQTSEALIQKPADQVIESTKIIPGPHLQGTESSETHLELECENTESIELVSFTVENTQKTLPIRYSKKELLKQEMQYENSEPLAQDFEFTNLAYKTNSLVVGSTQCIMGPQSHIMELTSGPQLQGVKSRQLDPEAQLQGVNCVNLIQQPDSSVVDSEKVIQKPTLQNMTEELSKRAQHQGMKLTQGPSLKTVRFSMLSPSPFLQEEKPADLISGPPYHNVQSDELTLGYPTQDIKVFIPEQGYQIVTPAQQTSEPHHQDRNFNEISSGPCLQNVRFLDLTPEPKHENIKSTPFLTETQFQVTDSIGFVTEAPFQLNQEIPVGDLKSSRSTERSPSHSTTSSKLISELQSVKSEDKYLRPRQEDVKFSELTSGPKLQGVKFREETQGSVFHDVNPMEATTEFGCQDSKLVKTLPGLQVKKQAGLNTRPWLQDVKFFDPTSGTQPQVTKPSAFNLRPQLQCVKFLASTSEPKAQGARSIKLASGPEQQEVRPEMLVSEPPFQGVKHIEDQTSSLKSNISYELASEEPTSDVESVELTPVLQESPNDDELLRSLLQEFKPSELIQGTQLSDVNSIEWMPISGLQDLKPEMTTESQTGNEKSVAVTLRQYLRGIKSLMSHQGSQLESKSAEIISRPQRDVQSVKVTPDSKLQCVKSNERANLDSKTQEYKTLELAPCIQLQDTKTMEQDMKALEPKLGLKTQGQDSVPFAPVQLFQGPQLQVGKLGKLTSEPQIPEMKSVAIASHVNLQREKSILENSPDSVMQSNSGPNSVKLTSKQKKQETVGKQMLPGIKYMDLPPMQQFQEKAPVNISPGTEQDVELSAVSPVQQHEHSEQMKRSSKPKDSKCLTLIRQPTIKGRELVSQNWQLQDKKFLELTPELNTECVKPKEVKFEPQLQSLKPPKLTQGQQLLQVKQLEPSSESPPPQSGVILEFKKEPQLENLKCIQWIPQPEFQGGDSVGLNLKSQSQDIESAESKPLIWLREVKPPKLSLGSKIQDITYMGPQFQRVKIPELSSGQQLQERRLLVSFSEPPLQGVKNVELHPEIQMRSMESTKWIPLPGFQEMRSLLNFESQPQSIKPTELEHLIQLRNKKSSLLSPRPKLQGIHHSSSFLEKPCRKLRSTQSCDLMSQSKPHDIKSILFQPRFPLEDGKFLELIVKPHLQEVKPLQLYPGTQPQVVKTPVHLQSDKAIKSNTPLHFKSITSSKSALQKKLEGVKSEVSSEPEWQCLQTSKMPLETEGQDKKCTELKLSSQLQDTPFSKVATGIKSPVVKSTDLNIGLLLQSVKTSVGTSRANFQDVKHKECKPYIQCQVMESSELIPGPKLQNVKSVLNQVQEQGLKSSKLISDMKFQDAESEKFQSGPQFQDKTVEPTFQKMKSVDCKSGPELQDMSFSRLITEIKIHDVKSKKYTADPQVKVVKSSEVVPREKCQHVKSFEIIPSGTLQGVKSLELNPSPKLRDEKSSEFSHGKKFPGVESVGSYSGPQFEERKCSDLIMDIKLKNVKSTDLSSIPQFQGMKSSAVIPGTKTQAEKSMFNSGVQIQSKRFYPLMKLQSKNSTEVNHNPEFQAEKSTKFSLGPRIHSMISSEVSGEKQGQVKKSSQLNPWPELQGVKFMTISREPQLQHIKSSKLCKETIHQDKKSIKLNPEQQFQTGIYYELLLGPKYGKERFSELNPGPYTKNELYVQSKHSDEQFQEWKHETKCQGEKSSEMNSESQFQGINVLAYNIAPLPQGVKSKLSPRPYHQDIKSKMSFPGSHLQADNSSTPIPEPKHQCVNTIECNTGPNKQCLNASETTANTEMQGNKSPKLNPRTERNLCQSETSTVLGPGPHFPVWKSQLITESNPLSVMPRKCNLGPQMQCNSPELNPRPKSQGVNSMRWKQQVPSQDIKSFELTLGTKLQDTGCEVNPGIEIQSEKYSLSDPGSHLQGLKCQLIPDSKPLGRVPMKCTPGPQRQSVNSPELLPGTKLQCTNSTGCRHGPPSQSIKCPELTSGIKLQDTGFKVNPGTETGSETPVVFHTEPHLQDLKSECISNSNCLPGATNDYNLEPQVQHADFSKLNAEPKVHCENYTGCKYGPPFQSINFFQLASGTKYKDMTSSGLNPESECQGIKSSLLNPLQNLHDIKCKLTPGTNFQVLMESNSRSQLQGMNSCNSNSESEYPSINSVNFNARPQMQEPKSYDLNPGPEFQGTTSILLNSGPHLQDVKISELTPCTNFPDLLLKKHLGSQQQVTQFVPTSDPQLNAVNFGAFLPESSLEDEMSVRMEKEALYCGANSVKLVSDPKKQDKKCELSSLEPCFQKVESVELNPRPHSQGINSAELLSPFRQHSVRPVAPVLEGSSNVKSPELKARPQPKDLNSKNYCLLQKSTVLGSEPCSQDAKSLESNLRSQLQSSLGLSSCLWSQSVKSDIFVPEPCFQDVKSVQLTPEAQHQGMNCQEFTSGQQGVKSMVFPPQEPSKKLTPAPLLTSVKISNLSPESQQQDMTSLELTSHPKLQVIKHTKFPLGFLQQTPKSKALATGPQLQRVRFENLTPRMSDQTTDFSELSSRPEHQFVEYAEMSPKPQHQIPQSVHLIPSMYQVTESSEIAQRLAHQNAKTVKKSGGLTPKPIGKVTESSGIPPETDLPEPEFADLTSMLRDQCSQSLELTPEKSHQSSESPGLIPQLWPNVKKLEELHIKQLKQDVESKEIIPELKHCLIESIKFILKARSQREGFSGMMREPQSISKATGHANKSPTPCSQAVEIIPEKRPYGQEYIALITKSTSSVTESSEMTQDENVEFTPETGPQVERSIKLMGIPQQKVEYSRLGHQVPGSVYLTSKQCSQGEESLELPPKEAGQSERHGQYGKETSETWQQEERSKWLTQLEKENMNYSEIAPGELGEIIKINRISPKPLDQINQPTKSQLQVARSTGVTPVAASKLESVKGTPGPPVQVGKFVILPPGSFSQKVDYIESISQPQDMKSSEFISGIWLQNKKPKKLIPEPTHQILETIEMAGFQIVKSVLFPGLSFQIVKSEKLAPGPIPQVAEPIGKALSLGPKERPCFDFLTMKHFQELAEPVELTPRSNTEVKSTEFASKTASPFMEPKGLTHEKKLQTLKSRSEKAGPSTVMESEDMILEQLCLNRESEELLSLGEVEEKYFPKFLCSSSNSLISSTAKTSSELGCLWDTEMPEVLRSLETKNLDSIRGPLSTHPLAIQNQPLLNIVNIAKNTHCEDLGKDMVAKMRTLREQAEEPKNSSKSLSQRFPKGWRSPGRAFQKRPGARRSLPCSVLRRQQNVWESHSWRQRLPRKYLSNMLMLGNVLQTNVERKLYSQSQLTEREDTHQSIENVFGIPPELMEFSQSLPEKGQSAISQPSVGKNYIQRNTLFHSTEKRMTLRMWTRQSMSSIIQQYSGARIRINKIRNISYISQEFIHHMTGSCNTEAQLPVPLNTCLAKDSVPVEESENSQSEFQHSHRPNYTSQDKTIFSEQSNLLQELQLKVAAKLLRSQVPPNVPPPLTSGLVLKYPICLKCGRCSGFNCGHKLQSSFGPYLLIYPQIHLVRTPEGRGEIRLHLGFRLRTGKRPQVPKYQRRDRPVTPKSPVSSPLKKTNIYTQVSRSPTSTLDLESGSSQSPLQDHMRQRSDSSCDLGGKTDIGEFSHYDVTQVQRLPDTDSESNQDENWAIVRRSKSKYSKRITKGDTTPSTKFYTKGRESRRELPTQLKRKKSSVSRTTTDHLERQPKKPSQPKLIQLLSQSIKQAFQKAYNILTSVAEKSEDGRRSDDKSVGKGYQPKQKGEGLSRDRMSVVKPNPRGSITKQKCPSWDRTDQFVSSQQPKRAQSFQPKLTHLSKPRVPQRSPTRHTRRMRSHQSVVQNDSGTKGRKNYKNETSSYESKNSETGNTVQARGRVVHDSSMKRTSSIHPKVKYIQSKNPYHSFGRTQYSASEKSHLGPSQRSCSLSERSHGSNSEKSHPGPPPRSHLGPSQRSHPSPSDRKCCSPSERRCRSSSERRFHSLSGRGHPHPSERKCHRPSDKIHHTPLEKTLLAPEKNHHRSSDRNHSGPSEKTHPTPSEKSHPSPSEKYQPRPSGRNQGSPSERIHPRIHLRHDWPPERSQRTLERRAPSHSESEEHSPPKLDLKHGSLGERPRHTVVEDTKNYPKMSPRGHPQDPPNKAHLEARS